MIKCIIALAIFPMTLLANQWISGDKLHVIAQSPSAAPQAVFFNSFTGVGAHLMVLISSLMHI